MTSPPSTINQLARQIYVFSSLVTKLGGRDTEQRIAAQLPGISGLGFGVMQILRGGSLTLGELAEAMMLAPATLVPVVDRLEEQAIVLRGRDASDRRRRPLSLTDRGREMLAGVAPFDEQDLITRSLRAIGEDKARQLNDLLAELLPHLAPDEDLVGRVMDSLNSSAYDPQQT
jgi:DNA-binding MarR family transcriptional regulator